MTYMDDKRAAAAEDLDEYELEGDCDGRTCQAYLKANEIDSAGWALLFEGFAFLWGYWSYDNRAQDTYGYTLNETCWACWDTSLIWLVG